MTSITQIEPVPDTELPAAADATPSPASSGGLRRPRWWVALSALGVCVIGLVLALRAPQADSGSRFETVSVDRGSVVARVTATGTLSALVTVQVGSQVSGRILALYADFNSQVKKGQVIARIDPESFKAAYAQVRANVSVAQANLQKAQAQAQDAARQADRSRALAADQLLALSERDTAVSNSVAAKAQVRSEEGALAQAEAALAQAKINLEYTDIVSPIDGSVISRNVDVGQTVAASLQAPTLFTIAEDLSRMQVDTNVAEADVGKLTPGMAASFGVDAYPGERFVGRVRQIRNAPQTLQNVVTYDAVIDVDNPDGKLKPGMTANVSLVHAQRDDVIVIPNLALRFRPPAGAPLARAPAPAAETRPVWVLNGGEPRAVQIRTGVTDGSMTELVSGDIKVGDRLVVGMPAETPTARGAGANGMPRLF